MINVHYFASIREALNCEFEAFPAAGAPMRLDALIAALVASHDERWQQALANTKVLMAINQVVADHSAIVNDGDEVAFFPPVTGG